MIVSNGGCDDEGCKDGILEEEDALSELMMQVKSLTAQLARLEVERCAKDFPPLEAYVHGSSTEDDDEDFINVEALHSTPDVHDVSTFDDYLYEEQQSPTSPFTDYSSQPVYDNYESNSELDMLDFQEQTAEPYPLFTKEKYNEEINHPSPSEDVEQHEEEQSFPTGIVYDDYESDFGERQGEELEEKKKGHFIVFTEPVSEQPPPKISRPTLVVHPPLLTRDIQPHVNNYVAKEVACLPFSGVYHWSYEPVKEYMELYFLHNLEPPYFISTSAYKEELKSVTILLSWLHHLFMIIDRRKELLFRNLLDWIWWKFAFT
jgi:hypothetical protein